MDVNERDINIMNGWRKGKKQDAYAKKHNEDAQWPRILCSAQPAQRR